MTGSEAVAFLEGQQRKQDQRHAKGCQWKQRHRWTDDGSCQRCEAWRSLGFDGPRDVVNNHRFRLAEEEVA